MTNEELKGQHEKAAGDRFTEYYNKENKANFVFKKQPPPPKPDLIYYDEKKNKAIGIEVVDAYYDEHDAKGTWNIARGKTRNSDSGLLINPDEKLAEFISDRIKIKCGKTYSFSDSIILLVVTRPTLTEDKQDFQNNVLPHIKLPNYITLSEIYLELNLPPSYRHYLRLYPGSGYTI
jgi:hypothetical protein